MKILEALVFGSKDINPNSKNLCKEFLMEVYFFSKNYYFKIFSYIYCNSFRKIHIYIRRSAQPSDNNYYFSLDKDEVGFSLFGHLALVGGI